MLKPDPSSSAPVRCALSVGALLHARVPRGGHLAASLQSGQLVFFCELSVREDQNIVSVLLCYRVSNAHICSCTCVAAESRHSLAGDAAAPCPGCCQVAPWLCPHDADPGSTAGTSPMELLVHTQSWGTSPRAFPGRAALRPNVGCAWGRWCSQHVALAPGLEVLLERAGQFVWLQDRRSFPP